MWMAVRLRHDNPGGPVRHSVDKERAICMVEIIEDLRISRTPCDWPRERPLPFAILTKADEVVDLSKRECDPAAP